MDNWLYVDKDEVQELIENDLSANNSEGDSESDGISVISEPGKTSNVIAKDEFKVDGTTHETVENKDYFPVICCCFAMCTISLAAFLAQSNTNHELQETHKPDSIQVDLENQANLLNMADALNEECSHVLNKLDKKVEFSNEARKQDTDIKLSVSDGSNEIRKDSSLSQNSLKFNIKAPNKDSNKIIKEKEPFGRKNNDRYKFIVEKEKELRLQEENLKRKEKFLFQKEYKLLQKEIELKKYGNQDKFFNPNNQNRKFSYKNAEKVKKNKNKRTCKNLNKPNDVKKKYNIISGKWFDKMHINREALRQIKLDDSILYLDNLQRHRINKARWYFKWMDNRQNLRSKRRH